MGANKMHTLAANVSASICRSVHLHARVSCSSPSASSAQFAISRSCSLPHLFADNLIALLSSQRCALSSSHLFGQRKLTAAQHHPHTNNKHKQPTDTRPPPHNQVCRNGKCVGEIENIIPDYTHQSQTVVTSSGAALVGGASSGRAASVGARALQPNGPAPTTAGSLIVSSQVGPLGRLADNGLSASSTSAATSSPPDNVPLAKSSPVGLQSSAGSPSGAPISSRRMDSFVASDSPSAQESPFGPSLGSLDEQTASTPQQRGYQSLAPVRLANVALKPQVGQEAAQRRSSGVAAANLGPGSSSRNQQRLTAVAVSGGQLNKRFSSPSSQTASLGHSLDSQQPAQAVGARRAAYVNNIAAANQNTNSQQTVMPLTYQQQTQQNNNEQHALFSTNQPFDIYRHKQTAKATDFNGRQTEQSNLSQKQQQQNNNNNQQQQLLLQNNNQRQTAQSSFNHGYYQNNNNNQMATSNNDHPFYSSFIPQTSGLIVR